MGNRNFFNFWVREVETADTGDHDEFLPGEVPNGGFKVIAEHMTKIRKSSYRSQFNSAVAAGRRCGRRGSDGGGSVHPASTGYK